jgi:hypothetical protein
VAVETEVAIVEAEIETAVEIETEAAEIVVDIEEVAEMAEVVEAAAEVVEVTELSVDHVVNLLIHIKYECLASFRYEAFFCDLNS